MRGGRGARAGTRSSCRRLWASPVRICCAPQRRQRQGSSCRSGARRRPVYGAASRIPPPYPSSFSFFFSSPSFHRPSLPHCRPPPSRVAQVTATTPIPAAHENRYNTKHQHHRRHRWQRQPQLAPVALAAAGAAPRQQPQQHRWRQRQQFGRRQQPQQRWWRRRRQQQCGRRRRRSKWRSTTGPTPAPARSVAVAPGVLGI